MGVVVGDLQGRKLGLQGFEGIANVEKPLSGFFFVIVGGR